MGGTYKKAEAACIAGGILIYLLAVIYSHSTIFNGRLNSLARAGPGDGTRTYELWVQGLENEKKTRLTVPVMERQYTDQEAKQLFEELAQKLPELILGENSSLSEVRYDLDLDPDMPPGIHLQWESEDVELLDSFGAVHTESLGSEGHELYLKATLTDGIQSVEYDYLLHLYPPLLSESQQLIKCFQDWLAKRDEKEQTASVLELPGEYEGKKLSYSLQDQSSYSLIPVLGVVCALFLAMKEKNGKQERIRRRERQLLMDYSEVISKLVVLMGAGMTIRLSWEKIVEDYQRGRRELEDHMRPAYEEMMRTAAQLKSGASEGRAYGEFGRRCGLQPYLKLGALLEQNQKTGSKNLKPALELEMVSAFEERKNLAKKLGEEAGTKLLLPLFLLLGVVMVMIVVPAFLAFF